jgi:hypothetical protein
MLALDRLRTREADRGERSARRSRTVLAVFALVAAIGVFASPRVALASVPPVVTHQGRLYDANDVALSGTLTMTFAIYDAANGGSPIWSEAHSVTFDDGYYSVALGTQTPLDSVLVGAEKFLGITIGADSEMTPRAAIDSVPYAILTNNAVGDITPATVSVNGTTVIDASGTWTGDPSGLIGPAGPDGVPGADGGVGPQGSIGPKGALGPPGPDGATGAVGVMGPPGPQGPTGPPGSVGPAGPMGAVGPQGNPGADGPMGNMGVAGIKGPNAVVSSVYAQGAALAITDSPGGTYAFISTPAQITTTAFNQVIDVYGSANLGSTAAGGANNLRLSVCRQTPGGPIQDNAFDSIDGARVVQNTRRPFSLQTRFTGLPPGTYNFGLCGCSLVAGSAATWNNDQWSRTTVVVMSP